MSRQQDTVIDDDEESCPLCIEEFDLSDKNFRPCPCGYQICQFCFNSLKNTYEKSTCPNCRRPYDEKTIQYKIPTAEEFKADQANKTKKQAAARRRETEKREVESSNRRNLAGVRVKQQNLVYVIGLVPQIKDENSLLQTLRGPEYFGQYGDIDKIVVSKAKPGAPNQGVGVYVTYARKEDAALCISTIDGSVNGDRVLRAQFGTTKYCSAFLRGETCANKNCSFLHETGEDGHSSSLQGEVHTKKDAPTPAAFAPPPTTSLHHPVGVVSAHGSTGQQGLGRAKRKHGRLGTPVDRQLGQLPSSQGDQATEPVDEPGHPSPQLTHAALASQKPEPRPKDGAAAGPSQVAEAERPPPRSPPSARPFDPVQSVFDNVLKSVSSQQFQFTFSDSCLSEEEREEVENFPVMIDPYGGAKRRMMQDREAAERARLEADAKIKLEAQARSAAEEALDDGDMGAGSLALGGEPEDNTRSTSGRGAIGRPSQAGSMADQFAAMDLRSLTPQQRQQLGLASGNQQAPAGSTAFEMSDFERRPATFSQAQYDQISSHQRHGSRYFNSEAKSSAPTRFHAQQQSFYASGVQGPPPGLPASGTPPVSGGGMFAHGNNFSNPGFGTAKDANADPTMRGRVGTSASQDVSKRGGEHLADPSIVQARLHQGGNNGQGLFGGNQGGYQQPNLMYGGGSGYSLDDKNFPPLPLRSETQSALHSRVSSFHSLPGSKERSSTPRVPPGFETTHAHPEPATTHGPVTAQAGTPRSNVAPVLPAVPTLPAVPRSRTPRPTEADRPESTKAKNTAADEPDAEVGLGSPGHEAAQTAGQQVKSEEAASQEEPKERVVPAPSSPPTVSEARRAPRPRQIDIPPGPSAATESTLASAGGLDKPATPAASSVVATPPLASPRPSTPATATSEVSRSSVTRSRTLRVTTGAQKPSTEPTLPSAAAVHSPSTSAPPVAGHFHSKAASRQQSISSAAKVDSQSQSQSRPSTPAMSERLASEGVSRASSPPPSVVGSAPERAKTKNQLKKERREKARTQNRSVDSAKDVPTPPVGATVAEAVGPIVARQKKQKKSKPHAVETTPGKAKVVVDDAPAEDEAAGEDATRAADDVAQPESRPDTPPRDEGVTVQDGPATDRPPYTLGDMYADAPNIRAGELSREERIRVLLNYKIPQSSVPTMFSSMIESGDLGRDHPWLNPAGFSFNSPSYKLPNDSRRGQDYLDAHGYVGGSYAFGHVYLPVKEKRALERGSAVGIANTPSAGDKAAEPGNGKPGKKHQVQHEQEDLLKRCLITPSGTVYRHLTAQEADKVLELEQRRQWYTEEFGEDVGGMHALAKPLEDDDYINLSGGMEELGRHGERHGVVWVSGAGNGDEDDDDDEDDDEEVHDDQDSDATDDLGIDLDPAAAMGMMPGAWGGPEQPHLPGMSALTATAAGPPASATLAPMRNQPALHAVNVNLRALDLETLQTRVAEKKKEADEAKKGVEAVEKSLGRWNKEFRKWREGVLKA